MRVCAAAVLVREWPRRTSAARRDAFPLPNTSPPITVHARAFLEKIGLGFLIVWAKRSFHYFFYQRNPILQLMCVEVHSAGCRMNGRSPRSALCSPLSPDAAGTDRS